MNKTVQELAVTLATNPTKVVALVKQSTLDALNAATSPSSTNRLATINDVDGTGAALTPATVVASDATDSTPGSTGAINTLGGIGATKAIFAGTTITAGTGIVTDAISEKTAGAGITISGAKVISKIRVTKPLNTSTVAAGSLITGAMIASGYIEVTGTTNSSAFDSAANITTAIGTSPIGTTFDFYINTMGGTPMTAGNVLTITAGSNTQFMKQISAGDSASAFLATITATAGVHSGWFRVTYDTATTISIQRIG